MKRTLLLTLLVTILSYIIPTWAENVLIKEAPITKTVIGKDEIIEHPNGKPNDCAYLRVYITPFIPNDFNLFEASGANGIDRGKLKWTNYAKGYIQFYIPIDRSEIRSLLFRADSYPKTLEIEVKDKLKINDLYETHIKLAQEDWVTLRMYTNPGKCGIFDEGQLLGESDENGIFEKVVKLKGYWFTFKKDGYEDEFAAIHPRKIDKKYNGVFDTKKMIVTINEPIKLTKIGDKRTAKVIFKAPLGTQLSVQNISEGETQFTPIPTNSTELPIGQYWWRATKKGYVSNSKQFTVEYGETNEVLVELDAITGILDIDSKPSKADVKLDGKIIGTTPLKKDIPIGSHTLVLEKSNYAASSPLTVKIDSAAVVPKMIYLSKTNSEWWSSSQYFPHHYLEAYYGMGITADKLFNHYIGLNYTYIRHAVGFNLSGMYGFNNKDIVATAGPVFTLTKQSKTDLDLQLLLGAGYGSILRNWGEPREHTWVAEAGLRFGFQNSIKDYKFSWWSIYLGAKYYDEKVVPTIGLSMMPIGIFTTDYCSDETYFSHVFLDPIAGYAIKSRDAMVGASFAWQKYNAGFYTSFMYGVLQGNIAAIVGPAFHLTPLADVFDLTLYGGIGYGRTANREHSVAGDLGLRFAWGDHVFNWYNFSLGCTTYGGEWIPTFGLSLIPVKGLAELAMIDASDFPSHHTEFMAAYAFSNGEWMLGTNYTWIQTHLGLYASFLIGFDGSATVNAGPVFRLTPDRCAVDLQIYQGVGWANFHNSSVGGETGIRMGFKTGNRFALYSLNLGVNYSADDVAISFGVSWPLVGLIGTAGMAAFLYH